MNNWIDNFFNFIKLLAAWSENIIWNKLIWRFIYFFCTLDWSHSRTPWKLRCGKAINFNIWVTNFIRTIVNENIFHDFRTSYSSCCVAKTRKTIKELIWYFISQIIIIFYFDWWFFFTNLKMLSLQKSFYRQFLKHLFDLEVYANLKLSWNLKKLWNLQI